MRIISIALAAFAIALVACGDNSNSSGASAGKGEFVDARDNQTYKTVVIGNQTWMAQNLNYNMENSSCYNDNPDNCAKYGRLYTVDAAMNACPSGWHLPSEYEWDTLMNAVGGRDVAGKMLKSESGWELYNGVDEYGFTAVPAGYYDISIYDLEGKSALFLCSRDDEHLGSEYVDVVSRIS